MIRHPEIQKSGIRILTYFVGRWRDRTCRLRHFFGFLVLIFIPRKKRHFWCFYSLHKHTSLKITWKKENLCTKVKINKWLKTCFTVFKNYKNVSLLLNLRAKNPKFTLPNSNISRIWIFAPKIQKLFFGPKINLMDDKLNFVQVWDILSDFQNTVLSWTLFSALEKTGLSMQKLIGKTFSLEESLWRLK